MQSFKNASRYAQAAFGVYALLSLRQLFVLFRYFNLWSLLWLAAYVCISVCLFLDRRDVVALAGFGVAGLISLFNLLDSGSVLSFVSNLLSLAANGGLCFLVIVALTDWLPQCRPLAEKLWFVPSAAAAGQVVFQLISSLSSLIRWGYFGFSLWQVFWAAAILLAAIWAVEPAGLPQPGGASASSGRYVAAERTVPVTADEDLRFNLVGHILLLLFTGGIWLYIWIYRVTKRLNRVPEEPERGPVAQLLLCMFVPFYFIYWIYKSAQRIDKLALSRGISSDSAMLCLILAIFVNIVPLILMQDKLNKIADAGYTPAEPVYVPAIQAPEVWERTGEQEMQAFRAPEYVADAPVVPDPPKPVRQLTQAQMNTLQIAEKLRTYRELLDNGLISQEEFEEKRKQLLELI